MKIIATVFTKSGRDGDEHFSEPQPCTEEEFNEAQKYGDPRMRYGPTFSMAWVMSADGRYLFNKEDIYI